MSDSLILEANHDTKMLTNGPYPFFLKKRILSDKGHISNLNSALAVLEYSNKKLKNIAVGIFMILGKKKPVQMQPA